MSRFLDVADRIVVFLVGLALLALGLWSVGLYIDQPQAQWLADQADLQQWLHAPDKDWFPWVVTGLGVLSAVVALLLIIPNLRRHRIRTMTSRASNELGSITIGLDALADAVAQSFAALPRVNRASAVVAEDHGEKTMTITINANADASIPHIREHAEQAERDLLAAAGDIEVRTMYKLHMAPVERKVL